MKTPKTTKTAKKPAAETYTLLIWEEVPESTKVAVIPNDTLDADTHAVLARAHGKYINSTNTPPEDEAALECVNLAMCSDSKYIGAEHLGSKWTMRFSSFVADSEKPITGKLITHVYRCGFLL